MEEAYSASLEKALAKTEADVDSAIRGATVALSALKKFKGAAKTGDLRELRKTIISAEQAVIALRQQFANAKGGWDFPEDTYFSGRDFISEILATADRAGLRIYEQDGRLFCHPFLVSISADDRAVLIDKRREKRLRPSVLISHLKELQSKPVRFKGDAFLGSLFSAYNMIVKTRNQKLPNIGLPIFLREIYDLLTLRPGQAKDYTIQEFGRDLYLLDESRITKTKGGFVLSFHPGSSTKSLRSIISVVTKEGYEKKYYSISFSAE